MNPTRFKNLIDVTKPPYCADNTEKEDCTEILRRVLNDLLIREAERIKKNGRKDPFAGFLLGGIGLIIVSCLSNKNEK